MAYAETVGFAPSSRSARVDDRAGTPPGEGSLDLRRAYRRRLAVALTTDLVALVLVSLAATRFGAATDLALVAPVAIVLGLRAGNLYRPRCSGGALDQTGSIVLGSSAGALAAGALTGAGAGTCLVLGLAASTTLLGARALRLRIDRAAAARQPVPVLVVGTGAAGQELAGRLLRNPEHGMAPVGFVDSEPDPLDPDLPIGVIGDLDQLPAVARRLGVERVIVDAASVAEDELAHVLDRAARSDLQITVLPSLARHLSTAITVEDLAGLTLLAYQRSVRHGVSWLAKRMTDVVLAGVAIVCTAPIWLATAIAIKLDSPGPVLFSQERVGRDGKRFRIHKFRSMTVDAERRLVDLRHENEADGPYFKLTSDPRRTRIGCFIRRYSIDELPQLINVLRGEMSLVGPRPALVDEVESYPDWFRRRLTVPPGLTGLWQVSGRFLLPFHEAARLDVFYADHWSFGLDLKILFRTPWVVLTGRGAR